MLSGGVLNLDYPDSCYSVRQEVPTKGPQEPRRGLTPTFAPEPALGIRKLEYTGMWMRRWPEPQGQEQNDSSVRGQKTKAKWK